MDETRWRPEARRLLAPVHMRILRVPWMFAGLLVLWLCGSACVRGIAPMSDDDSGDDDGGGDDDSSPPPDARPGGGGGPDGGGGGGPDAGGGESGTAVTCAPLAGSVTGLGAVLECVPEGMEGKTGTPAPLVVALHGYTQTAEEYKDTTEWHRLAARYHFYVVFPQTSADLVNAGGRPAAWKWWRDFLPWKRSSYNQHFGPLLAVVDKMKAAHDIDPERVFITGLSAGGYMTTLMLACYPDVFAAGAAFSGGAHNCDLKCTDSNKLQDWTRPPGYVPPSAADVKNAWPEYWNDAAKRKPRLLVVHGSLDEAVKPINLDDAMKQWTGALGIDATPDNATLGLPQTLGGYPYNAYAYQGGVGVATMLMTDLGHGTPVYPGSAIDQGGHDPIPSKTAADCSNVSDPSCMQDWTNTGTVYGAYQAARFFGLAP
jgi:poly(hydroxyalkanoate) depolymerase family esterase